METIFRAAFKSASAEYAETAANMACEGCENGWLSQLDHRCLGYGFGAAVGYLDALLDAFLSIVTLEDVLEKFRVLLAREEQQNGFIFSAGELMNFFSTSPMENLKSVEQRHLLKQVMFDQQNDSDLPDLI